MKFSEIQFLSIHFQSYIHYQHTFHYWPMSLILSYIYYFLQKPSLICVSFILNFLIFCQYSFFFLLKHLPILIFLSIPIFSSLRVCDFKDSKNYAWKNSAQFLWMIKRLERKLYLLKWLPVSSDYGRGGYQKPSNPKQGTIGQAIVEAPHQAWLLA